MVTEFGMRVYLQLYNSYYATFFFLLSLQTMPRWAPRGEEGGVTPQNQTGTLAQKKRKKLDQH